MRAFLILLAIGSLCSCGTAEFSGLNGKVRHAPAATDGTTDEQLADGDKTSAVTTKRLMLGFNVFSTQNAAIRASTAHLGASQQDLEVEFDIIDRSKN